MSFVTSSGGGSAFSWEKDSNSPATLSGNSSYSYTLGGEYDQVLVVISNYDTSSTSFEDIRFTVNNDGGTNYRSRDVDGSSSTNMSSVGLGDVDTSYNTHGHILMTGRWDTSFGMSVQLAIWDENGAIRAFNDNVSSPLDRFDLDEGTGENFDMTLEVYGRDTP